MLIMPLVLCGFIAVQDRQDMTRAAVLFAIAGALKLYPVVFLVLFVMKREWSALAVAIGTGLGLTLLSAVVLAGGPVAVIAGSRVTMPYAMTLMAGGLMDECFRRRTTTIGQALLHAKQNMVKPGGGTGRQRAILHALAYAVSPARDKLAEERAEHLRLFNLIGDPLLRLRHPQALRLEVPAKITAGARLTIAGRSPVDGRGTVEMVVRRDRLTFRPPLRGDYPQDAARLAEFQEIYRKANDRRLKSIEVDVGNGRLAAELDVPEGASGPCHVRVFVEGSDGFALGSAAVEVAKPAAAEAATATASKRGGE